MEILVFRTDIKTKKKVKQIKPILELHHSISDWFIDTNDIDNVLRVETNSGLQEMDVIRLIQSTGFRCEALPD